MLSQASLEVLTLESSLSLFPLRGSLVVRWNGEVEFSRRRSFFLGKEIWLFWGDL